MSTTAGDGLGTALPPLAAGVRRLVLIILDGVGIGSSEVGGEDPEADTLGSVAAEAGGLDLPYLSALGLADLVDLPSARPGVALPEVCGSSVRLVPLSHGKDTLTGHWELAGLVTSLELRTFPEGLPPELLARLAEAFGRGVLGGEPASGTEIIARRGPEHLVTGKPIVYTSADSVLQIAAHHDVLSPDELYRLCRRAREIAQGPWLVGRVIARPFTGTPGCFERTAGRRDYSLPPPGATVLDAAVAAGVEVIAVGKIDDVFAGRGISRSLKASGNAGVINELHGLMASPAPPDRRELVFANLNDFDSLYGHRRDPTGFAGALEGFDADLGRLLRGLDTGEILLVTADHGCDPTYHGTDHTREDVPLLITGTGWPPACYGTVRGLHAVAGLIAAAFGLPGFDFWPRKTFEEQ